MKLIDLVVSVLFTSNIVFVLLWSNQRDTIKILKSQLGGNPYKKNRCRKIGRLIKEVRLFCYDNGMSRQSADEAIFDVLEVLKSVSPYGIKGYGIKNYSFYVELKHGWLVNLIHKR